LTIKENKAQVTRLIEECWNNLATLPGIDEILVPEFVFNYAFPGMTPSRDTYKQVMKIYAQGFPDWNTKIDDMFAVGDKVAVRSTNTVTHTGDFMGFPPTGNKATATMISIFRIKDGKIVEEWSVANQLLIMQQLGLIPSNGP
jgi:steroid delta-isomerase-like uncharacterized protein